MYNPAFSCYRQLTISTPILLTLYSLPYWSNPPFLIFWHLGALALNPECQSAWLSKIKNGGLDQYGAGPFEQQQLGTAGVEGVNKAAMDLYIMIDMVGSQQSVWFPLYYSCHSQSVLFILVTLPSVICHYLCHLLSQPIPTTVGCTRDSRFYIFKVSGLNVTPTIPARPCLYFAKVNSVTFVRPFGLLLSKFAQKPPITS